MTRFSSYVLTVAVVLVAAAAVVLALLSLRWPLVHDLPIMLYVGFLVADLGAVPYLEVFDMNAPGTILVYALLHVLTDGQDLPLRLVHLFTLLAIGGATSVALRRFGWRSGVLASACFALACLCGGPNEVLQRETLCMLLLAVSAAMVFGRRSADRAEWVFVIAGLCAGAAVSIKPPVLIFWLPLFLDCFGRERHVARAFLPGWGVSLARAGGLFAIGLLVSLAAVVLWLAQQGALTSYLDMIRHYYPLYAQLGPDGEVVQPSFGATMDRYVVRTLPMLAAGPLAVLAFVGIRPGWESAERRMRPQVLALVALVGATLLYIPIGGKFWFYHQIPLFYALSLCAGLAATTPLSPRGGACHALVVLAAAVVLLPLNQLDGEFRMWHLGQRHPVRRGQVEALTTFLRTHAGPDDKILPLDVSGGAIHAMYELRYPLHGRFIYDLHFYHHVDDPYIASLRQELVATLTEDPPDFVIRWKSWRPHGYRCSKEFPELDALLDDYSVVMGGGRATVLSPSEQD